MKPRDLDFIPEMVGGKEKQPAGAHIHDRARTGTTVGKAIPLVDANAKSLDKHGTVTMLGYQTKLLVELFALHIIMLR